MKALEHLNMIVMAHGLNPSAPTKVTACIPPARYDYPGVIVIGDSVDAFDEDLPGAPTGTLVCYGTSKVSSILWTERLKRDGEGRQTVAVVIPARESDVRRALGEDVAALLHVRYREQASNP